MLALTLRGIAAHKIRLLLSATAVMLGIAFLAGTMVLTDTVRHSVDQLQDTLSAGSDVSVRSRSATGADVAERAPVPAAVLEPSVRRVPGVASATGSSVGFAQVADPHGRLVGAGTSVGIVAAARRPAQGPRGPRTARRRRGRHGRRHRPQRGPARRRPGDRAARRDRRGRAAWSGWSATARSPRCPARAWSRSTRRPPTGCWGRPGATRPSRSPRTRRLASSSSVAGRGRRCRRAWRPSPASRPPTRRQGGPRGRQVPPAGPHGVRRACRCSSSAFLIVNTFSMLVSQRAREFGLLRAVGATSRQVFAHGLGRGARRGRRCLGGRVRPGVAAAHGLYWLLPASGVSAAEHALQVRGRSRSFPG